MSMSKRAFQQYAYSLLFAPCLLFSSHVIAAPAIASISGTVGNGQSITISGSGFGSNNNTPEFLGPYIEQGTSGSNFSKSGWDMSKYGWSPVRFASNAAHSGSQSLETTVSPGSNWNGEFTYHLPNPVGPGEKLFVSWWAKYNGGTNGQWKMLRLSGNDTVVDGTQEMVFFNWLSSSRQLVVDPGTGNDQTFWPGSNVYPGGDNRWYRMDVYIEASSAGSGNGVAHVTRYDGSSVSNFTANSLRTHTSSGNTYSHVIFQNYIGNGISGSVNIWLDDLYIQNSQARVELCDSSSWSGRHHCEIQAHSSWADGSIRSVVNTGSFTNGQTTYVYVVDGSGNVNSSGYRLASCDTCLAPPSPPNNIQ
jgi:hypothetical protein